MCSRIRENSGPSLLPRRDISRSPATGRCAMRFQNATVRARPGGALIDRQRISNATTVSYAPVSALPPPPLAADAKRKPGRWRARRCFLAANHRPTGTSPVRGV
jgi:hypothetical protein